MRKNRLPDALRQALIAFVCLPLCAPVVKAADASKSTGEVVALPVQVGGELKASADDTIRTLAKMTGREFTLTTTCAGPGVWLTHSDDPTAPPDVARQLAGKGRQPFAIRWSGDHLLIVANSDDGLCHGLYYYLDQLGARWYLPNENWTVIPHRDNIRLAIDKLVVPAFKVRGFFGTGGFGRAGINRHTDLEDKVPGQWTTWMRRNRFGGEFSLGGHAGEDFNLRNKATLLAHPEYLAEIGGNHVPFTLGAKPDVSNPDMVKLYVDDRLNTFRRLRQKAPNSPYSFAVSVEPADGGGYCTTGPCVQIGNGSASDQTFYLANETAKAVAKEFPDGHVSLLAYGEHAAVPSFALEPNMFVSVVPYGFQRTGLSPEELIEAWAEKLPELGMYDYWSIPDWAQDQPNFNFIHTAAEKIRFWHEHHVVSFTSESTFSAGAMGPGWHVSSRLLWDPSIDVNAVLKDFYANAFGPARQPMQRMLERWANGFVLTEHELGLSYADLVAARKLAVNDSAVMARLDDYAGYLHYLRLLHEFQHPASAAGREEAAGQMLEHIWNINHTAMVHTFRLTQLMVNRYFNDPELVKLYDFRDKHAEGWERIKPLTHEQLEALVADGAAKYKPLDFEARGYGGPWVPATPTAPPRAPDAKPFAAGFIHDTAFDMLIPTGMRTLPLSISGVKPLSLKLRDNAGKLVYKVVVPAGNTAPVELPFAAPGHYNLYIQSQKSAFEMQMPDGVHWTMRNFFNSQGRALRRLYFYVPRGLKTIAVYISYILLPIFYDGDGKPVQPSLDKVPGIVLVDVPPGQDGRIWALGDVKAPQPLYMMNVPHAFAFSPDALLVPQDALKP